MARGFTGVTGLMLKQQVEARKRLLARHANERRRSKSYGKRTKRAAYDRSRIKARQDREYADLLARQTEEREAARQAYVERVEGTYRIDYIPPVDWYNMPTVIRQGSRSAGSLLYENQEYFWGEDLVNMDGLLSHGVDGFDRTIHQFFRLVTPRVYNGLSFDPDRDGTKIMVNTSAWERVTRRKAQ